MARKKIDLSKSKLVLEKSKKVHEKWTKKISEYLRMLKSEQSERVKINEIRQDFFLGNQEKYTNIIGLQKKEKKGHANAIFNYAGRTCIKIYYSLANNPPVVKVPGLPVDSKNAERESIRAQGVEEFLDYVFNRNRFWFSTYPRAVMNQIVNAVAAIKVYYDPVSKQIKIVQKENTNNLYVGWKGDNSSEYSFVIDRERRSVEAVEKEFGIKIYKSALTSDLLDRTTSPGSHEEGFEYGTGEKTSTQAGIIPTGKTDLPKVWVTDFWDEERNVILVNDEPVQYVEHEWGFNPWVIIPNIQVPGRPWGLSDIDFLIDPQIEFNETSNDTRDFIRSAVNLKYVARNMPDFDAESVKTGSGQVIYVDGDDADFQALPQPVNTFPSDLYLQRIKRAIHDLGIPEVSYGGGASDSGRAKAIDYQSMVDIVEDKRRSWRMGLEEITERIQKLGYTYFPKDFWKNPDTGRLEVRPIELDWSDIIPLTSAERVTNIINKYQAGIISLKSALSEAGYKDVEAEIEQLKREESDPELAPLRHRVVQLIPGVREAAQEQATETSPPQERATPTLTPSQNQGQTKPMSLAGTRTAFTTPEGFIQTMRQNLEEKGQ